MTNVFLLLAQAWAEGGGHEAATHGDHAVVIPWHSLFVQTFNFVFLFALLGYLLAKTVKAHFENRAREYDQLVRRAEEARAEAERGKIEIQQKLEKLSLGAEQTVAQAKAEADELRNRLMDEARGFAQKLQLEAQRTAAVELEKAKSELRHELLHRALESASESLKKNLGTSEQKKLQNEFAEKIQVVGG